MLPDSFSYGEQRSDYDLELIKVRDKVVAAKIDNLDELEEDAFD